MKITRTKLRNLNQTVRQMKRLAYVYRDDVAQYATWSIQRFYNLIRSIPYRKDPDNKEVIKRPWYTLKRIGPGGDCDDKAIVIMAWAHVNNIRARFVAVGIYSRKGLHHIITELYYNGNWIHVDPTYSYNTLGRPLYRYVKRKVF